VAVAVAPGAEGLAMHAAIAVAAKEQRLMLDTVLAFAAMFISKEGIAYYGLATRYCLFDIIKTLFFWAHADDLQNEYHLGLMSSAKKAQKRQGGRKCRPEPALSGARQKSNWALSSPGSVPLVLLLLSS
jgi:hypothetical protein